MPILQHQSFTCVKEKKSVPILEQIVYYKCQEVEQRKATNLRRDTLSIQGFRIWAIVRIISDILSRVALVAA